jgi:hypothetical protein
LSILGKVRIGRLKVILSHLQPDFIEKGLVTLDSVKNLSCPNDFVSVLEYRCLVHEQGVYVAYCKLWALLN